MRAIYLMLFMALLGNANCSSKPSTTEATTHAVPNKVVQADVSKTQSPNSSAKSPVQGTLSLPKVVSPMLTGKPYLSIEVEASNVPFEVFVNSGYVTTDLTGSTASEKWPINPLLRAGANEIGVVLYGWADAPAGTFEEDAKLTLRVLVKQAGSEEAAEHELFVLAFGGNSANGDVATEGSTSEGSLDSARNFSRVDRGDIEVGPVKVRSLPAEHATILTRSLNVRLPFPEWSFLRSDRQTPTVELTENEARLQHDALLNAYEEIWSLLSSRSLDRLMPLFEERSREIDLALYQEPGTTQAKLREAFESALADTSCTLAPVRPKNGAWYYNVAPGGQLARLSTSKHGGAVIRFKYASSDYARVYPIMFRKQGSRYIVSR